MNSELDEKLHIPRFILMSIFISLVVLDFFMMASMGYHYQLAPIFVLFILIGNFPLLLSYMVSFKNPLIGGWIIILLCWVPIITVLFFIYDFYLGQTVNIIILSTILIPIALGIQMIVLYKKTYKELGGSAKNK